MILTRTDVSSLAACVAACNDGGVFDPLLAKLRELWRFVDQDGLRVGGRFCGTCGDRVCVPNDSEVAGCERRGPAGDNPEAHAPETDDARKRGDAGSRPAADSLPATADYPTMRELEYEPGAPDTEVVDETNLEDLARPDARASTVAAVAAGVAAAEREQNVEEPLSFRRRRRTKPQIELPSTEGEKP